MTARGGRSSPPSGLVLQAFFSERPVPSRVSSSRFARTWAPHSATAAAQLRAAASPGRPPHPATVVQPQRASRAPHPATVAASRPAFGAQIVSQRGPAQRKEADVHAFLPPSGFLQGETSPGQPLPPQVRLQMERYFEADLSDVRVHVGPEAESIGALAFTVGEDLYFQPAHYQPHTHYGLELLGHELTHVMQQREGRVANPFGSGVAVVQDNALEEEADRCGREAAQRSTGPRAPRFSAAARAGEAASRASGGVLPKMGYRLVVGAYMHDRDLPEPLAGHSFVAIEEPDGRRQAFGFSPAGYGDYDPRRDIGKLARGVKGVVHDDLSAFEKPGVRTHEYPISSAQARAALEKVREYQSGRHLYSLDQRQCSTFALDVMRAASVPVPEEGAAPPPRVMYEAIED